MPQYLVTSVAALGGGVFLFDSGSGSLERIASGCFRGITLGPDGRYYTVTGHRRHHRPQTHIHRLTPGRWTCEDLGAISWKGCHDLRWFGDAFYLVSSTANTVVRLGADLGEIGQLRLVEGEDDICHVNCLAEREGEIFASLFTLTPGPRAVKRHTHVWTNEGKIVRLDFAAGTFEVCFEPLAQPHNLLWHTNSLYVVESHTSRLTRVDLAGRRSEQVLQFSGFVRGLSIGSDEAIVGINQTFTDKRQPQPCIPWTVRVRERLFPFTGLVIVDPETWRIRQRFEHPGLEAYDILPLSDSG